MSMRHHFERDGYMIACVDAGYLERYIGANYREPQPDAIEWLSGFILSVPVLALARKLLGHDLVYYGEGMVNYEPIIGLRTLRPWTQAHRDMPHAGQTPFQVIRCGVYFNDHSKEEGGLTVWPGSHLANTGEALNVPSGPGDMVVWNLRTLHAAGAHGDGLVPATRPRNALFFDFGAKGPDTDAYIAYRVKTINEKRAHQCRGWNFDTPEIKSMLSMHGIELRTDILDAVRRMNQAAA